MTDMRLPPSVQAQQDGCTSYWSGADSHLHRMW